MVKKTKEKHKPKRKNPIRSQQRSKKQIEENKGNQKRTNKPKRKR